MWAKIENWTKINEWWILAIIGAVVLRIPSLFEPYWYGDEGIYLTIGRAINMGVRLYSQIHDNKPPLLYMAAAIAGGDQFWFRLEALVVNVLTVYTFSRLMRKVFEKESKARQVATWIFVLLTCVPFWEGNIANAELFFLLPTTLAMLLIWDETRLTRILIAGIVWGVGGLFKVPAILEAAIWPIIWVRVTKGWAKKVFVLGIGVLVPIILSCGYYYWQGSGNEYAKAAWTQNIPYLSSWKASSEETGVYLLKNRAGICALIIIILFLLVKKTGTRAGVVGAWGAITLFSVLLSGRPYPHYLLQMAGVVAIVGGIFVEGKPKEKLVGMGVLLTLLAAWVSFKFYVYPTAAYYANFADWIWGRKSKQDYYAYFNGGMKDLYETAAIIKAGSDRNDKIFVWGDVPMIYALAERIPATKYMVEYHIKDFKGEELTMQQLTKELPEYVVIADQQNKLQGLTSWLQEYYLFENKVGNYEIYKLSNILTKWARGN